MINETITTSHSRFGQSVFKVRNVELLPEEDESGAEETTTEKEEATTIGSTSTTTEKAYAPATSAAPVPEKKDDEDIERGSPEVYEPERTNEISQNIDDGFKVKPDRNLKIVQQV